MADPRAGDWVEYQRLVLAELERHSLSLTDIAKDVSNVKTEIALLKLKSGLWGAVAGMIPVLVVILVKFI